MNLRTLRERYNLHYGFLARRHGEERAAELAVGGDFLTVGALEYCALRAHGLERDMLLVDVGCGTGRLAHQLALRVHRRYAGFDIARQAIDFARRRWTRPGWSFETTEGIGLPIESMTADRLCFFSVFRHLSHKHTFQ